MDKEKRFKTIAGYWSFAGMFLNYFFFLLFTYGLCDFALTSQQEKEKSSRQAFAR